MTPPNDLLDHAIDLFPAPGGARDAVDRSVRTRRRRRKAGTFAVAAMIAAPAIVWAVSTVRSGVTEPQPQVAPVACPPGRWLDPERAPTTGDVLQVTGSSADDLWVLAMGLTPKGATSGEFELLHLTAAGWDLVPLPKAPLPQNTYPADAWSIAATPEGSLWAADKAKVWRYEGDAWTALPVPVHYPHYPVLLAFADDDVIIGGSGEPTVLRWDGEGWTDRSIPYDAAITDLAGTGSGDLWGLANVPDPATPSARRRVVVHWDGSSWSEVERPGAVDDRAIVAAGPEDVWLFGLLTYRWDGEAWKSAELPGGPDEFSSNLAVGPTGVWFYEGSSRDSVLHRWDGESWVTPPPATGLPVTTGFHEYARIAVAGDAVVIVHGPYGKGGTPEPIVAVTYRCG